MCGVRGALLYLLRSLRRCRWAFAQCVERAGFPPAITPRSAPEAAWLRKDRRVRAHARALVRVARAAGLLEAHHSAQQAMRWDGPDLVKGAPRDPPWGCGECGEALNWACRAKCRGKGCNRQAPNHVLQKLRNAQAAAAAGNARVGGVASRAGGVGRHTPAPWRQGDKRQPSGGGHGGHPLPADPPAGVSADDWRAILERVEAAKLQQGADKVTSKLPEAAPAGVSPEDWNAIRERNEAALTLQADVAAAKATPQQLLKAAEKAARLRQDLERQLAAACQKVEKLTVEVQEAKVKEHESKAASLTAQVPSVAELPCSVDSLLEGFLVRSSPALIGSPELLELRRKFEEAVALGSAACAQRLERERQEEAGRAKEVAESAERVDAAANQPVGMELDDLDYEEMDDITLQAFDRNNPKPLGGDDGAQGTQVEAWRTVLRGVARKQAELLGNALAAKRAKLSAG